MDTTARAILWQQFGAAIDMFDNAMRACPDELWGDRSHQPEFWYVAYHTLFWLDLYLSEGLAGFAPPAPFNLDELDPPGVLPEKVYTKDELRAYLAHGREKCRTVIEALTEEKARAPHDYGWGETISGLEILLYNMRHVQHHAAQLNLLIRQKTGSDAPRWVVRAT